MRRRTTQIPSRQKLVARNPGANASGKDIERRTSGSIEVMALRDEQKQALQANLAVMHGLDTQIKTLARSILAPVKLCEDFHALRTVSDIGEVLTLTLALETGDIGRFAGPGNFAFYARTVDSRRESNGKKRGEGNAKCGNKHLAWAFIEAVHFAVHYDATIRRW